MSTIPRQESAKQAPIINIATRQPVMTATTQAPKQRTGRRLPWCKIPFRMDDPDYLALTAGARSVLLAVEQLERIAGTMARCAAVVGLDRKTFTAAVAALEGKFITVERSGDTVTITPTSHVLTTDEPRTDHAPTTHQPRTSHKQSANDAGYSDHSLKENKSENKKENIPPTPQGDDSVDLFETEFWPEAPKVKGRAVKAEAKAVFNRLSKADKVAAIAGMRKHKALHMARPDFGSSGWEFFKSPQSWLRKRMWETLGDELQPSLLDSGIPQSDIDTHNELRREFENARRHA